MSKSDKKNTEIQEKESTKQSDKQILNKEESIEKIANTCQYIADIVIWVLTTDK